MAVSVIKVLYPNDVTYRITSLSSRPAAMCHSTSEIGECSRSVHHLKTLYVHNTLFLAIISLVSFSLTTITSINHPLFSLCRIARKPVIQSYYDC